MLTTPLSSLPQPYRDSERLSALDGAFANEGGELLLWGVLLDKDAGALAAEGAAIPDGADELGEAEGGEPGAGELSAGEEEEDEIEEGAEGEMGEGGEVVRANDDEAGDASDSL